MTSKDIVGRDLAVSESDQAVVVDLVGGTGSPAGRLELLGLVIGALHIGVPPVASDQPRAKPEGPARFPRDLPRGPALAQPTLDAHRTTLTDGGGKPARACAGESLEAFVARAGSRTGNYCFAMALW